MFLGCKLTEEMEGNEIIINSKNFKNSIKLVAKIEKMFLQNLEKKKKIFRKSKSEATI